MNPEQGIRGNIEFLVTKWFPRDSKTWKTAWDREIKGMERNHADVRVDQCFQPFFQEMENSWRRLDWDYCNKVNSVWFVPCLLKDLVTFPHGSSPEERVRIFRERLDLIEKCGDKHVVKRIHKHIGATRLEAISRFVRPEG